MTPSNYEKIKQFESYIDKMMIKNDNKDSLLNAYKAVLDLDLEQFFRNSNPPDKVGYMFWNDQNIYKLAKALEDDCHSGSSFTWVCRCLQTYFKDYENK